MILCWWLLFAVVSDSFEYDCTFVAPDGVVYDLAPMGHSSPPDYSVKGSDLFEYRANICSPVFQPCNGDYTGIATQWHKYGPCAAVLGRENPVYGGRQPPEFSYLYEGNPSAGISVLFKNGDFCFYGAIPYERKVRYDVKCDQENMGTLLTVEEVEKCVYVFEFLSIVGCPPSQPSSSIAPPDIQKPSLRFYLQLSLLLLLALYSLLYYCSSPETRTILAPTNLVRKEGLWKCCETVRNMVGFAIVRVRHCADLVIGSKDRVAV